MGTEHLAHSLYTKQLLIWTSGSDSVAFLWLCNVSEMDLCSQDEARPTCSAASAPEPESQLMLQHAEQQQICSRGRQLRHPVDGSALTGRFSPAKRWDSSCPLCGSDAVCPQFTSPWLMGDYCRLAPLRLMRLHD